VSYGSDTLAALEALARSNGPLIVAVTVVILVWLGSIAVVGWLADRRNREGGNWATLAMFFGPFAILALLVLAKPAKGPALTPLWAQIERQKPGAGEGSTPESRAADTADRPRG
jgi:uncharacterized protein (DUF983 family)